MSQFAPYRIITVLLCLLCLGFAEQVQAEDIEPGRLAIVIDDIGNRPHVEDPIFIDMMKRYPAITYAVLFHKDAALGFAHEAHSYGHEIIIHMPMESCASKIWHEHKKCVPSEVREKDSSGKVKGIYSGMNALQARDMVREAFSKIFFAIGMNNHQGSWLTSQPSPSLLNDTLDELHNMRAIVNPLIQDYNSQHEMDLPLLKQTPFFLDSRTSAESKAETIACKAGLSFAKRKVFLDHIRDYNAIDKQFDAIEEMLAQGIDVIAIGHPYEETRQVLEHRLTLLEASTLRPLSELMNQPPSDMNKCSSI